MDSSLTRRLEQLSESDYREFAQRLTPDGKPLLGVRLGAVRAIAKELSKYNRWDTDALGSPDEDQFHEEKLVRFLALAYAPIDEQERIDRLENLLDYLDSWALCDSLSTTLKKASEYPSVYRKFIKEHVHDPRPYVSRFAIVLLLNHFMTSRWIPENLVLLGQVESGHYYIKMAVAWAIATAFTASPEEVLVWFDSLSLDREPTRMAAQKVRDSKRVSLADKGRFTESARSKV